jgi:FkbM family methyltransferase
VAKLGRVRVVGSALGNAAGTLEFFENEYSHASSALPVTEEQRRCFPQTAKGRKIIVPVTTLDQFAAGQAWPRSTLLKLDVQGFEQRVLEGAQEFLDRVDYLLFECSFRPMYEGEPAFHEMFDYVRALGFELVAPVGFLANDDRVIVQTDLLWRRR